MKKNTQFKKGHNKNKTYKEIYGKKKAQQIKEKQSISNKSRKRKGKKIEEFYDGKKAKKIREKISKESIKHWQNENYRKKQTLAQE